MSFKSVSLALIFLLRLHCGAIVNVINYIATTYGEEGRKLLRRYENHSRRLEKAKLDLSFLIKCKVYNVFPRFLKFKLYRKSLYSTPCYKSIQSKLLNNEINFKKRSIQKLSTVNNQIYDNIKSTYSLIDSVIACRYVERCMHNFIQQTNETHKRKLSKIGIDNELAPCNPDNVVFNYSSVFLTNRMKTLLAFGLDFCLPVYKLNFYLYFLKF